MDDQTRPRNRRIYLRVRIGLLITLGGLIVYLIGASPELFGLNRSPPVGFIQVAVFLIGLAIMCLGGYLTMNQLWAGIEKSITADVGLRMVATGYVIAVAAGGADLLGLGTHTFPHIPYFGPWQAFGVLVGEAVIATGFLLMIPSPHLTTKKS